MTNEELEAEVARLNGEMEEWSRQNRKVIALEVDARKRAEAAERQLAAARATLASVVAALPRGDDVRAVLEGVVRDMASHAAPSPSPFETVSPGAWRQRERRRRKRALRLAALGGPVTAHPQEGGA